MICGKMLQKRSAASHMPLEKTLLSSYHQYTKFLWSTTCGYVIFFFCFENTRAGYHFIKKRNIVQRGEQKHPTHPLKSLISCLYHFGCLCNYACHFLQYRKWDEIENRLLRRELLITENLSVQKYTQCPPDVISDPLDDCDGTPSEIADETQRQARSHQVICLAFYS